MSVISSGTPDFVTVALANDLWKCLHDAVPCYLANLCVPAASAAGHCQSHCLVSGAVLVPWTRTSTGQCSFLCMDPECGTDYLELLDCQNTVIQALAQDLPLPALVFWLQLCVSYTIVQHCCDCSKFYANYKCADLNWLSSLKFTDEFVFYVLVCWEMVQICWQAFFSDGTKTDSRRRFTLWCVLEAGILFLYY